MHVGYVQVTITMYLCLQVIQCICRFSSPACSSVLLQNTQKVRTFWLLKDKKKSSIIIIFLLCAQICAAKLIRIFWILNLTNPNLLPDFSPEGVRRSQSFTFQINLVLWSRRSPNTAANAHTLTHTHLDTLAFTTKPSASTHTECSLSVDGAWLILQCAQSHWDA